MHFTRLLGFALLAVGLVFLYLSYRTVPVTNASTAAATEQFTDSTVRMLIGGIGFTVVGMLLAIFAPRMPKE